MTKLSVFYKMFAIFGLVMCITLTIQSKGFNEMTIVYMTVISSVWITLCYIPQVVELLRTKNADGISVDFWLNLNVALLALTISTLSVGVIHGSWGAFITEVLNLLFALTVLYLVVSYRKQKDPS